MAVKDAGPYLLTDSTPDGGATAPDVQDVTREALKLRSGGPATAIKTTRNGRQALAAKKFVVVDDEGENPISTSPSSPTRSPTSRTTSS